MVIPKFRHNPTFAKAFAPKHHVLSGGRWTYLRNRYLRINPACERCGSPGEEVHHMVPRSVDASRVYDPSNLMTLCLTCHRHVHRAHQTRTVGDERPTRRV